MQQRQLGRDGPSVPVIGFGAWPIGGGLGAVDERDAIRTLHHAFEQGVTLVDTAEAYRTSEELVGRALATWTGPRDRIFVATKVRGDDLSASHIAEATERSLRRLGVDTIDLLQAHSWDAYQTRSRKRCRRSIGWLPAARSATLESPTSTCRRWKLPGGSDPSRPCNHAITSSTVRSKRASCPTANSAVSACWPTALFAKGLLTGRYEPGYVFAADDERAQMARFQGDEFSRWLGWTVPLGQWAEERGHTLLELAIAWVLSHPEVTVCLCGAKLPEQIDDHVRAANWHLSTDDRLDIDRILGSTGPPD